MDNKNGGQASAAPGWNAWAAVAKNNSTQSKAAGQSGVLTPEQQSARRQQQTATDLARKKLLETYKVMPSRIKARQDSAAATKTTAATKAPRATPQDWQKYHSAWQNYYQKYYGEYYGKAAREYVVREKMKMERDQLERERKEKQAGAVSSRASTVAMAAEDVQDDFRAKIRRKAEERASKIRRSRHFIPLIIGGLILLFGICFQYNQVIASHIVAYVSPGNTEVNEITAIDPTLSVKTHEKPYLMIPKLNIEVPVIFGAKNDVNSMNVAMDNGVANFSVPGASAAPGEIGNFVISGHSAGNIYQQSNYKFIFSGLTRMKEGDLIYMDYNDTRYAYKVTGTKTVKPTDVAALKKIASDNEGKPMITLITCVPLGTSRERLLVYGEQISPSYENAVTPNPNEGEEDDGKAEMPANQDSPLESFWKWLTGQS